jgi:hypothetical protein
MDILTRRNELLRELEEIDREIEQSANAALRAEAENEDVLARYIAGDYVIMSFDRHWWVNQNGELIERVSADDFEALKRMEKKGYFKKITFK